MPKETMKIPIDPRYPEGSVAYPRPQVTSNMKAECIGEFSFEIEETCPVCYDGEPSEDCEVCKGQVNYTRPVTVPWGTCKDIYKRMASAAAREIEQ
jgi:hypothetical protein